MYTPKSFKEDRLEVLHSLIDQNGFGVFVSQTDSGLMATHLPFEVDPNLSIDDQCGVVKALKKSTDSTEVSVAKIMASNLDKKGVK